MFGLRIVPIIDPFTDGPTGKYILYGFPSGSFVYSVIRKWYSPTTVGTPDSTWDIEDFKLAEENRSIDRNI